MLDARELGTLVKAAEEAAAAGDYASAAERLREAARLQETHLSPLHPDLANTLNNLGVVYDKADRPGDAEECYRRAYVIATTVLAPDHPFVATSGRNLRDFCRARGIPFESEWPSHVESRPTAPMTFWRLVLVGAASLVALAFVMLVASRPWSSGDKRVASSSRNARRPAATRTIPAAKAEPVKRSPVPLETKPPSETKPVTEAKSSIEAKTPTQEKAAQVATVSRSPIAAPPKTTAGSSPLAASSSVGPTVADARLCKGLSTRTDWRCDPANGPLGPGSFFFYTRLLSSGDTTVEHRWYRGDRVHQVVKLRIRANQGVGYRTYSRNTVSADRAGDWRVELRTKDGLLLHEERFSIR